MSSCCSGFACAAATQFDDAKARADLAQYRRRGPDPTTRMLATAIQANVRDISSVLDIGAGIGVLTHELIGGTSASATVVEASEAYLRVARDEAARRGLAERYAFHHGDFVDLAAQIPEAHAVTMDRVVCCYPAFEPLLDAALGHARSVFAFSYPRDRWFVRATFAVDDFVRRVRRNPFRTFVHPPSAMHAVAERHGFRLVARDQTVAWCAELWQRTAAA